MNELKCNYKFFLGYYCFWHLPSFLSFQSARARTSVTMWPTSSRWRTAPSSRATWRFYLCLRQRLRTSGVSATQSCEWWPTMCCCSGSTASRPSPICSPTWRSYAETTSSSTTLLWFMRCCSWKRWASTVSWISPGAPWGSRKIQTCATWPP